MLNVPQYILKKLMCAHCGGYLSSCPIMLTSTSSDQICGKCFKILPDDKKTQCIRQIGLEAVAEVLVFPCRYNLQGCTHTFVWNEENNHEANCPHRYNTLPLDELTELNKNTQINEEKALYTCDSNGLEINVRYENVCDDLCMNNDKLRLSVNISANNSHRLSLSNSLTDKTIDDIAVNIESMLSAKPPFKVIYCHGQVESLRNNGNVYETIPVRNIFNCNNCSKIISNNEIYHCLFGHNTCKNCKGVPCLICGRNVTGDSYSHCKNIHRGCAQLFRSSSVKKHEIDCEFNDIKCMVHNCNFLDSLQNLIKHFTTIHRNILIIDNKLTVSLTRRDKNWYFYCYERMFHCRYYYFDGGVEFVMEYVGSNDKANDYKYEIKIVSDHFKDVKSKSMKCLGWNEISLGKTICFKIKDDFATALKFDAHINILQ